MDIRTLLKRELKTLADPERAVQQQAYMKSAMPYAGLTAADLRRIAKAIFKTHPLTDRAAWLGVVLDLWRNAQVREERYAAIELLAYPKYSRQWRDTSLLPTLQELITSGAWWDYVDNLATNHVGPILQSDPNAVTPEMRRWSRDRDLWLRRSAILAQLKFKDATDTDLLVYAIEGSLDDSDFFARKAIGWALRAYSRTDPTWVRSFVQQHQAQLSALSKKEALRLIS